MNKMGSKMTNVLSKRRPRNNIISIILAKAKKVGPKSSKASTAASSSSGSVSGGDEGKTSSKSKKSRSRRGRGSGSGDDDRKGKGSSSSYHGSKKGIIQSAVELTRRSKQRATSRSRRVKSKGRSLAAGKKKSKQLVKGQKAFYRSDKGISKVTVVGIHHDAKRESYYTIKLRDGKEKQTDGKHLTAIKEDAKTEKTSNRKKGGENSGGRSSRKKRRPSADQSSDSSIDVKGLIVEDVESEDAQKLFVGQYAYYRSSESITKVRILSHSGEEGSDPRYVISLPDGSRRDDVKPSLLATLTDLTSEELSMLMKERNERRDNRDGGRGHSHSRRRHGKLQSSVRKSKTSARNDNETSVL
mmetsp:Transcript_1883/g.3604  ORF Transcript_1883/g.3604 Transcript_1883/m.3604 type:complete len:357 (-) Transcript_1883:416-1486(-)